MNIRFVAFPRTTDELPLFGKAFTLSIYLSTSYRPKGGQPKTKQHGVLAKIVVDDSLSFPALDELRKLMMSFESSFNKQNEMLEKYEEVCSFLIKTRKDNKTWDWLLADPYKNFPILKKKYKSLKLHLPES